MAEAVPLPNQCPDCLRVFSRATGARRHIADGVCPGPRRDDDDPRVACPDCGGLYASRKTMRKHQRRCPAAHAAEAPPAAGPHVEVEINHGNAAGRDINIHNHNHGPTIAEILAAITPELLGAGLERAKAHTAILGMLQTLATAVHTLTEAMAGIVADDLDEQEDRRDAVFADSLELVRDSVDTTGFAAFAEASALALAEAAETQGATADDTVTPENTASASWRCRSLAKDPRNHARIALAHPSAPQPGAARGDHPTALKTDEYLDMVRAQMQTLGHASRDPEEIARRLLRRDRHHSRATQKVNPLLVEAAAASARRTASRIVRAERRR
jgi:hypothetical protein